MLDIVACPSCLLPQPDRKRKVLQQKPSDPYCTQQHAWAAFQMCPEVLELCKLLAAQRCIQVLKTVQWAACHCPAKLNSL